jgi:hypothetical protein
MAGICAYETAWLTRDTLRPGARCPYRPECPVARSPAAAGLVGNGTPETWNNKPFGIRMILIYGCEVLVVVEVWVT